MPEEKPDTSSQRHPPSPYQKEQDPAIFAVFSEADQPVLTTKEIADELEHIGLKQTRRRLFDLVDEEILETRKPSRDRIWWLITEIEEPITVRYPLLRHVRNRFEVLVTVLGALLGLIGAFTIMLGLGLQAYEMQPPLLTNQDIFIVGLYAIMFGMAGMIGGIISISIYFIGRRYLPDSIYQTTLD
jgi:hypothetical protein